MRIVSTQADYDLIRDPFTGLREAYDRAGKLSAVFHGPDAERAFVAGCAQLKSTVSDFDNDIWLVGDVGQIVEEAAQ